MMNKIKYTIIITLIVLLCIIIFPKNKKENKYTFDGKKSGIYLKGDLITYLDIKDKYKEKGAIAKDNNGKDISSNIIVNYYNGNRQVFEINTSYKAAYTAIYQAKDDDKIYEAKRVIIINDNKPPIISDVEAKTVTIEEVPSLKLEEDIKASDDSGKVTVRCDNTVKAALGEYIIICKAKDRYGNESEIKRLIKVVETK